MTGTQQVELNSQERALARLMRDAHLAGDYDLPRLFNDYAEHLGVTPVLVYLVDLQQRLLVPFRGAIEPEHDYRSECLGVDSTPAGQAFQRLEVVFETLEVTHGEGHHLTRAWLPLLDGAERLGVLGVTLSGPEALDLEGGALRTRLLTFASLAAELVMTKTLYGDTIVRLRRSSRMGLAAEKQWSMLPPLTFGNEHVIISGAVEPAYVMGGDTVDYAVGARTAHLAILDGMGHGVRSAQLAALAVSAYRNARRHGTDLTQTVRLIDEAIQEAFAGDAFLTGQIAELNTDSGVITWISAGHPPPLMLRDGGVLKELFLEPTVPLGLGDLSAESPPVGTETLEPGDMVLFYSDGVVDARSPDGEFFGVDRLVGLVTQHLAEGLPAPETLRLVIQSLLDHQHGHLDDDATVLLVQFAPEDSKFLRAWGDADI